MPAPTILLKFGPRLCVALACASLSAYAAQDKSSPDAQRGPALIQRAAEEINPSPDNQPVLMKGKFRLLNLKQGELDGDWALLVAPDDRSHLQIRARGISLEIWTDKELEWQKPFEAMPLPLRRLIGAFQLRDMLLRPRTNAHYKVFNRKRGSQTGPCVELQEEYSLGFTVCIDELRGTPFQIDVGNDTYQFFDYQGSGSRSFPLRLSCKAENQEVLEIRVGSLTGVAQLDPVLLLPPQGITPIASPRCPGGIKKKITPDYPMLAKVAQIQGTVEFRAIIDLKGKITSLELVSGHPMLVDSAKTAVSQWEYTPLVCNGKPSELEKYITVHFNLSARP